MRLANIRKFETINYHDFMKRDYKKARKVNYKILSVTPLAFVNGSSFFTMSPMMTTAYLLIGGVGIFTIIVCLFEDYFVGRGDIAIVESILAFLKVVMPLVFIAAAVYIFSINPINKWL